MDQLLVFTAVGMEFGLELGRVRGIHKERNLPAGGAAPHGSLLDLEGERMPLWDLGRLTSAARGAADPFPLGDSQILVIEAQGGKDAFALRVEGVEGVVSAPQDQIRPLPSGFGEKPLSLFPRVLVREKGLVLVVDPRKLRELGPTPEAETSAETQPMGEAGLDGAIRELLAQEPIRAQICGIMDRISTELAEERLIRLKRVWRSSRSKR